MRPLLHRIAPVVGALILLQGVLAPCAGWAATPDARRQCCETQCPQHHDHGAAPGQMRQATADQCCAQAPPRDSSPSGIRFASTITVTVLQPVARLPIGMPPGPALNSPWDAAPPPARLPKHLLLSVLLV